MLKKNFGFCLKCAPEWKIEKLKIEKLKNWKIEKLKIWKIEKLKKWKNENYFFRAKIFNLKDFINSLQ